MRAVTEYLGQKMKEEGPNVILYSFLTSQGLYWLSSMVFPYISSSYNKMDSSKKGFWCCSFVSTLHAIFLTLITLFNVYQYPEIVHEGSKNILFMNESNKFSIAVFLGYIISDILIALYYGKQWNGWLANLLHHVSVISVWGIFFNYNVGHYFACIAQLCEVTTPFVNQRWFLYESNLKHSKLYFYNGIFMTFAWFVTRIIMYSGLGIGMITTMNQWWQLGGFIFIIVNFNYLVGLFLQYFWFTKIMKGALKTLQVSKGRAKVV